MEDMKEIVERELKATDALDCIWGEIPEEFCNDLVNLVIQKMQWAYDRGYNDAQIRPYLRLPDENF